MRLEMQDENPNRYEVGLDWLSYTSLKRDDGIGVYIPLVQSPSWEPSTPHLGYRQALRDRLTGVVVLFDAERTGMGQHYIMSGTALGRLLELTNCKPYELCEVLLNDNMRATRLDVRFDVFGAWMTIPEIAALYKAGEFRTNAKCTLITGLDGQGDTLYVGSRMSERFARVYDKAAQQQLTDVRWVRVELELKSGAARNSLELLADSVTNDVFIHRCRRLLSTFMAVNDPRWTNLLYAAKMGYKASDRAATDTGKWLRGQVAQAIRRYLQNGGELDTIVDMLVRAGLNLADFMHVIEAYEGAREVAQEA